MTYFTSTFDLEDYDEIEDDEVDNNNEEDHPSLSAQERNQ